MQPFTTQENLRKYLSSADTMRRHWRPFGFALMFSALSLGLAGCGGGGSSGSGSGSTSGSSSGSGSGGVSSAGAGTAQLILPTIQSNKPIPTVPTVAGPSVSVSVSTTTPTLGTVTALVPDPGLILMLVPDGQNMTDSRISAWQDAASEEGVRLRPITDAQFLSLGATATSYAGLILPDSLHTQASDALIVAIRTYTQNQGRTMLVYDFGALSPTGLYPATGPSRLSDLAGVQYIRYAELLDRTTGLGPVRALRKTMRSLLVPPGKSQPYVAPSTLPNTATVAVSSTLQGAAGVSGSTTLFLPTSTGNPGGATGFDPQQFLALGNLPPVATPQGQAAPRTVTVSFGNAFTNPTIPTVSQVTLGPSTPATTPNSAADNTLEAYSGYLFNNLIYPVYATAGNFGGAFNPSQLALADSPQFGLVAGVNPVGTGKVLFVNMPLTYLKGRTDALPMHGFLHYFARNVLNLPHLSSMPNGVAGMSFDWHLDSLEAQTSTLSLMSKNVFNDPGAKFSIGMTAGPDTIAKGDKLGWDLPNNLTAQSILTTFNNFGHSVGSHGGWIHDFYGSNVSETNETASTGGACLNIVGSLDNFLQCLVINSQAISRVVGRLARVYSAPNGNNPPWAMSWLESQGVVAAYFGGHTGLGVTRQYRDGVLANPSLWVSPVTPQGQYATFEEFQLFNVPKADVNQWYRDLIDFDIAQNTSRMVYAHPPGADLWYDVLSGMFSYAKTQRDSGKLAWYTMTRLADFMTTRLQVTWTQTINASTGETLFSASHPVSLNEFVWRLPKTRYSARPVIVSGTASIGLTDPDYWLVKAEGGNSLTFTTKP